MQSPISHASHLSTRSLFFAEGLVYMVIRRQAVSMRTSDSYINATQLLRAAYPTSAKSRRRYWLLKIKSHGMMVRQGGQDHWWLPFADGVFLCQAVGLEDELQPMILYPQLVPPRRESNYLLQKKKPSGEAEPLDGLASIQFHGCPVAYEPDRGLINATQLLRAGKLAQANLTTFFRSFPSVDHITRQGNGTIRGTYVSFGTARLLCQKFQIDSTPLDHIQTVGPILEAAAGLERADNTPGLDVTGGADPLKGVDMLPSAGVDAFSARQRSTRASHFTAGGRPQQSTRASHLTAGAGYHRASYLNRSGAADDSLGGVVFTLASASRSSDNESIDSQLESQSEEDYYENCWLNPLHPLGGGPSFTQPLLEGAGSSEVPLREERTMGEQAKAETGEVGTSFGTIGHSPT